MNIKPTGKKKHEHHQIKECEQEQTQENHMKPHPNQTIQRIETQQNTQLIHF